MAFDRALARHPRKGRAGRLLGGPAYRKLPELAEIIPLRRLFRYSPQEQVIAVDRIKGTVGSNDEFDVDFLPTTKRSRPRFASVFAALYAGDYVPPIDVNR